ncbi:hypothetical protein N9X24_01135, partial [Rickettsiales bacterium]|nr:hypothetical protein [Rickettsiales bacterium]
MASKIFKITFHILIFITGMFFLSFLTGIITVDNVIALFNLEPESNGGKAVTNIFSELKIVTYNL